MPEICKICFETLDVSDARLKCTHIFHKPCLEAYLLITIKNKDLSFKCPMEGCFSPNRVSEFEALFKIEKKQPQNNQVHPEPQIANLSTQTSIIQDTTSAAPSSTNRRAQKILEKAERRRQKAEQERLRSVEKNLKLFELKMQKDSCMLCSKCQIWVYKAGGCPHMKCFCGHEFCYFCGATWKSCICEKKPRNRNNKNSCKVECNIF